MSNNLTQAKKRSAGGNPRLFPRGLTLVVLVALVTFSVGLAIHPASAQNATLRIDPSSQSVAAGQGFTVQIIQNADFQTLGAAATLQFDPNVVQVTGAEVGPVYADGLFLFGGGGGGQAPEQAIAEANTTGLLPNITTLFLPGAGSVPPGDAVVATISMSGVAGGTSALNLVTYAAPGGGSDANSLGVAADPPDQYGNLVPVSVTPGEVTVAGGGGGGGGATPPPAAAAATETPATSATPVVLAARANPNAAATVSVAADSQEIPVGGEGKVELKVKANVKVNNAETDISFDKNIIEVTKIETGGGTWKKAQIQVGIATGDQKVQQSLADGNSKGELKSVGVTLLATSGGGRVAPASAPAAAGAATPSPSSGTPPAPTASSRAVTASPGASPAASRTGTPSASGQAGSAEEAFLVLTVKGLKNGETELKLKNAKVVDENDFPVKVTAQNGKIVVGEGGESGGGFSILGFVAGLFVLGGLGGGGAFAYRAWRRRNAF